MIRALGPGYGTDAEDEGLSAMVMMPKLGGLTFVAMMVVAPEVRGRGLGRRLLEHALASARAPVGLYATEMGRPLYERLGFVEVDRVSKHIGELDRAGVEIVSGGADEPPPTKIEPDVTRLDREASGADRSDFFRCVHPHVERVVSERDGFALRWHNGDLSVVGPIVAGDEPQAIGLLERAVVGAAGRVRVDIPVRHEALARRAVALGLHLVGTAPLMTWPRRWKGGERARYFAIALQAFG